MSAEIPRRSFVALLTAALAQARGWAQVRPAVNWVWMGACTASGVTIKAHARPGTVLELSAAPAGAANGAPGATTVAVADAHGVATFVLDTLRPRTRYRYAVGTAGTPPVTGAFTTFADGPMSFRAVFASCASSGSRSTVFSHMLARRPDLFIHMGDLHYRNIHLNDRSRFASAYQEVLTSPTQSQLFRHVPVAYTWDDHDYGPDNSDSTSPSRPAALASYRTFVPHYPLDPAPESDIHQAFWMGRARVLVTDNRSARSPLHAAPSERTMLGAAQLAWLLRELEAAAGAPLVIWVNTVPWITRRDEATDEGWAPYAVERQTIAEAIRRLRLTGRLLMLSGDAHMLAIDDGTHTDFSTSQTGGFPLMHAGAFDRQASFKAGPYSEGAHPGGGQFALATVDDGGGDITVTLSGRDHTGTELVGYRFTVTESALARQG